MISAIFVETNGAYFGLKDIDPWDDIRDARLYPGPYPVVAHPPCQRWGKMWFGSPNVVAKTGIRKIKGDDNGCFKSALESVRKYGGVLEHPWGSHAWKHFGLNLPPREGGWISADLYGGWTCCVEQGRYGHYARKPTLLYSFGCELPELDWGIGESRIPKELIDRVGIKKAKKLGEVCSKGGGVDSTPRIHTPELFRELLISIAESANKNAILQNNK